MSVTLDQVNRLKGQHVYAMKKDGSVTPVFSDNNRELARNITKE